MEAQSTAAARPGRTDAQGTGPLLPSFFDPPSLFESSNQNIKFVKTSKTTNEEEVIGLSAECQHELARRRTSAKHYTRVSPPPPPQRSKVHVGTEVCCVSGDVARISHGRHGKAKDAERDGRESATPLQQVRLPGLPVRNSLLHLCNGQLALT